MCTDKRYRLRLKVMGISAAAATVLFLAAVIALLFMNRGLLPFDMPDGQNINDYMSSNGLVELRDISPAGDGSKALFVAHGEPGDSDIAHKQHDTQGLLTIVRVMPGGILYNMNNSDFSGCRGISVAFLVYLFLMSIYSIMSFLIRCRWELFSYTTLFYGGMSLFLPMMMLNVLKRTLCLFTGRGQFSMLSVFMTMRYAGEDFLVYTFLIVMIFAVALAVSNISLIRHEGKRLVNLLGLILSALLICGYTVYLMLINLFSAGSAQQMKVYGAGLSIFSTIFVYFETMLFSAVICGFIAAKRRPHLNKTHVIILGCAIREDGTPLPLLQGRIDRAIAFAEEQKEKTGREIVFVPSGGKGSDEIISESQSMADYLVSKGISRDRIIMEDKSVNTAENMRFSLEKIREQCDEPEIVFSTTGYHVLRSGMISRTAGLDAEGMGSPTKWYFWPNAFVREFVGLLASKWKRHIFWIGLLTAFFIGINMILPM